MSHALIPVISIDKEKGLNCHKGIAVCSVTFCNDASTDSITLNHDLCIGCGACHQNGKRILS